MEKSYFAIAAIVVVVIIFWGVWHFALRPSAINTNNQNTASQKQEAAVANTQQAATATTAGLGSQIYQQTQNPLQNKLPNTNPVKNANPLQGAYTNPF